MYHVLNVETLLQMWVWLVLSYLNLWSSNKFLIEIIYSKSYGVLYRKQIVIKYISHAQYVGHFIWFKI